MKITISRRVILALLFAGQSSIATNHYPVSVPLVHDSTDYSIEADNEEADFEYLDGIDSFGTEDKEDDKPGIAFEKDESVGERSAINKERRKINSLVESLVAAKRIPENLNLWSVGITIFTLSQLVAVLWWLQT